MQLRPGMDRIIVLLWVSVVCGCTSSPWSSARRPNGPHSDQTAQTSPEPALTPPQAAPPSPSGSVSPAPAATTGTNGRAGSPDASQSLPQVMAELRELGELDPAAQAQLMEDLQQTDPAIWPLVVQHFRAAIEYRQQALQRGQPELQAAGSGPGSDGSSLADSALPPASRAAALAPPSVSLPAQRAAATGNTPSTAMRPPTQAATHGTPECSGRYARVPGPVTRASFEQPGESAPSRASTNSPATSPDQPRGTAAKPLPAAEAPLSAPSRTDSFADWQQALEATIGGLENNIAQSPTTAAELADHARLRMLYVIAGQREDALRPIPTLEPSLQDFWTKELYGLSAWLDSDRYPEPSQRAAETKRHLVEAATALGETAPLAVRSLAFCDEIQSFGAIHRFDEYVFRPGQRVLLYAEVDNFQSEPSAKGYHTQLRSSYEIFDMQGRRVAEPKSTIIEEHCSKPRRDFFIAHDFLMPRQIYPGNYTLQLTIEDLKSKKVGQSSIEFSIQGQ